MRKVLRGIDRAVDFIGAKVMHWFCVALVLVVAYEVFVRFVLVAPTLWAYETSMMISGLIAAFAWSYVHLKHEHIRVDVFYVKFSPRKKAGIDVIGYLIFFFPLFIALVYRSWQMMVFSWKTGEVMAETFWYPPIGPSRTAVFLGLVLILAQGAAHFVRDVYFLVKDKPYDV